MKYENLFQTLTHESSSIKKHTHQIKNQQYQFQMDKNHEQTEFNLNHPYDDTWNYIINYINLIISQRSQLNYLEIFDYYIDQQFIKMNKFNHEYQTEQSVYCKQHYYLNQQFKKNKNLIVLEKWRKKHQKDMLIDQNSENIQQMHKIKFTLQLQNQIQSQDLANKLQRIETNIHYHSKIPHVKQNFVFKQSTYIIKMNFNIIYLDHFKDILQYNQNSLNYSHNNDIFNTKDCQRILMGKYEMSKMYQFKQKQWVNIDYSQLKHSQIKQDYQRIIQQKKRLSFIRKQRAQTLVYTKYDEQLIPSVFTNPELGQSIYKSQIQNNNNSLSSSYYSTQRSNSDDKSNLLEIEEVLSAELFKQSSVKNQSVKIENQQRQVQNIQRPTINILNSPNLSLNQHSDLQSPNILKHTNNILNSPNSQSNQHTDKMTSNIKNLTLMNSNSQLIKQNIEKKTPNVLQQKISNIQKPVMNSTNSQSNSNSQHQIEKLDNQDQSQKMIREQNLSGKIDNIQKSNQSFRQLTMKNTQIKQRNTEIIQRKVQTLSKNEKAFYYVQHEKLDMIKNLFYDDKSIKINMLDDNNNSLLMVASYSGNYEIVKFLLEFGINKNLKNKQNNSALYFAKLRENTPICLLLEQENRFD